MFEDVKSVFGFFKVLPDVNAVKAQFDMWTSKWKNHWADENPRTAVETLDLCDASFLPTAYLRFLASNDLRSGRSLSVSKLLKTYRRSRKGQ